MKNYNLIELNKILLILFPGFLISGPFLTDASGTFIGLSILIYLIVKKKLSFFNNNYFYFFILIYIFLNLSSLFSNYSDIAFRSSFVYFRLIFFIFGVAYLIKYFAYISSNIYKFYYLCILILLIDSLIIILFNINIFGNPTDQHSRIRSLFGDEAIMGSFVSRTLPLIIGVSYLFNLKNKDNLNYILIFVSIILVILSGERTAIANIIIFIFFFLFLNRKFIIKFFSLLLIIVSIIHIVNPDSLKRIINHTKYQLSNKRMISLSNETYVNDYFVVFSYRHTLHYFTALEIFQDYPILGGGIKSFRYLCSDPEYVNKLNSKYKLKTIAPPDFENGCNTHPHHIYLQFLAETGVLGFVLFLSIFLYVVYQLFILMRKSLKLDNIKLENYYFLVAIFISMFPFLPSGNYFNNWFIFINYFPIGFYLASKIR